jgi:hypothetical protein
MNKILVEELIEEHEFNGYKIKELLTRGELINEGKKLHHCVGGYARAIKELDTRIISIRKINGRVEYDLTLEIIQNENKERTEKVWRVGQIRGLLNREVNKSEYVLGEYLALKANKIITPQIKNCLQSTAPLSNFLFTSFLHLKGFLIKCEDNFNTEIPF